MRGVREWGNANETLVAADNNMLYARIVMGYTLCDKTRLMDNPGRITSSGICPLPECATECQAIHAS